MALIKCPECGREISDKALTCPHCGVPINLQFEVPVTFYRKKRSAGALVTLHVTVGTQYVGDVKNGGEFTTMILPGTYQIQLDTTSRCVFAGQLTVPEDINEMSVEILPKTFGVSLGEIDYK